MITCKQAKEMITLYIDNDLSKDELSDFEKHLQSCEQCKEEVDFLQSIIAECNAIEQQPLPDNFRQQLHQKLIQTQQDMKSGKPPWYLNWRMYSGLAAGIILVIVMKTQIFNTGFMSMNKAEKAYVHETTLESYSATDSSVAEEPKIEDERSSKRMMTASDDLQIVEDENQQSNAGDNPQMFATQLVPEKSASDDIRGYGAAEFPGELTDKVQHIDENNKGDLFEIGVYEGKKPLLVHRVSVKTDRQNEQNLLEKLETIQFSVEYRRIEGKVILEVWKKDFGNAIEFLKSVGIRDEIGDAKQDVADQYQMLLTQYRELNRKIEELQNQENPNQTEIEECKKKHQQTKQEILELQNSISKCIIEVELVE